MAELPEVTTRAELAGTVGMVASTHWLASAAGMAVLERGGNAFDAAVATGLVLQVVEPHLNGPAGEVPVIAHHAGRGETFVLCGQGTAPAAATPEAFAGLGLDLVPGSGLLAACVPGAFGAWMMMLREFGTLRLRDVLGYAIGYAAGGYPLVPAISWGIASVAGLFPDHWTRPWGQGPVFLQQLALLGGFDLAAMGPGTADFVHTVTECGKLAFADREAWYGDPGFTDVPVKALLSDGYAESRRGLVGPAASA